MQVAAITRQAQRYCLMHVEGNIPPCVNGNSIGAGTYELVHGDTIDIAGARMKFQSIESDGICEVLPTL